MTSLTSTAMANRSIEMVNHEISRVLYQQPKVKEIPDLLKSAAEAFQAKSYNKAAKYYKKALDSKTQDAKTDKTDEQSIVLIKYILCACWLESTDAKDLLDALQLSEELVKQYSTSYPMLYYAVGKANVKLYRFSKADEKLKFGNSLLTNDNARFDPYCIPGSDEVIPESLREGFMIALASLGDQCFPGRRPDAVCCWAECSNTSCNEGADKNIFFGSPTFNGMIQITCNHPSDPCVMSFHVACWKAKKESLELPKKISPKELGTIKCFTPKCVDDKEENCTLKKIEVFNDQACVKSITEARTDDGLKHAKVASTQKGAIKKQQQPKAKVSNENRPLLVRNPKPPVTKEAPTVDGNDEDDSLHNEQALTASIDKLGKLRAVNFGLTDEKIWRPNLANYGNNFMEATADLSPDPSFSNDITEDTEKAFILSYMFTLLSNNGPMKMEQLEAKWKEAQDDVIKKNCEYMLENHVDIADFLTQSLKFVIIGDYICTADKLAEAHALTKNHVSEIFKFFMDNDTDQQSTTSSLDDDAVFNDIINHEKNNGTIAYPTIPDESEILDEEAYGFIEESNIPIRETQNMLVNGHDEKKDITEREKRREVLGCPDQASASYVVDQRAINEIKPITNGIPVAERKSGIPDRPLKVDTTDSPVKKNVRKRSRTPDISKTTATVTPTKNSGVAVQKTFHTENIIRFEDLTKNMIKGAYSVENIENELKCNLSKLNLDKLARETKSTNDLKNHSFVFDTARDISIDNDVDAKKWLKESTAKTGPLKNTIKSSSRKPEVDVHPECTNNLKLIVEMEELRKQLVEAQKESDELKLEIERLKKEHITSKGELLMRILRTQYDHNKSIINAKMNEWRKNYKLVIDIQQIVHTYTGQIWRANESEMLKSIGMVEDTAAKLEAECSKLNEQLSESLENGNPEIVDLSPVKIPMLPNCDVTVELLKSAFNMYKVHAFNQHQATTLPPGQPRYVLPPYGQTPYHYVNLQASNSNIHGLIPQENLIPMPNAQSGFISSHPVQGNVIGPQPFLYGQQQSMQQASNRQMQFTHHPPALRNRNPVLNAYEGKTLSHSKPTQPNIPIFDRAQTDYSQKTASNSTLAPDLKSTLRQLDNLSMKMSASQTALTSTPTTSGIGPSADETSNHNPQIGSSSVNIPQSKNETRKMEDSAASNCTTPHNNDSENASSTFTENASYRTPGRSLDRLMRRLRSQYTGVLELDLLKSVECVRKQRKSLSHVPMIQIIRDVDKYIEVFQQTQLCGYGKPRPNPSFASRSSTPSRVPEGERQPGNSVSSPSSVTSIIREHPPTTCSKKQWEPVSVPNDTWKNTEESECTICYETMENTETHSLQCKHSFHKKCIENWHKYQSNSEWVMGSCPLCRLPSTIDNEYPPLPLA